MLSLIKKSLIWIVSGTVSVILTACYGMPVCSDYRTITKKIILLDPQGDPIPGLKINIYDSYSYDMTEFFSDEAGQVTIAGRVCDNGLTISIEDVDGAANGYYPSQESYVYSNNDTETIIVEPGEMPDSDAPALPDTDVLK